MQIPCGNDNQKADGLGVRATDDKITNDETMRAEYERRMVGICRDFEGDGDGLVAIAVRTALVDELVGRLWAAEMDADSSLAKGIVVVAVGGYGRGHLFPYSDIDLLFCAEKGEAEAAKDAIRRVSQALWDCGMRVSPGRGSWRSVSGFLRRMRSLGCRCWIGGWWLGM